MRSSPAPHSSFTTPVHRRCTACPQACPMTSGATGRSIHHAFPAAVRRCPRRPRCFRLPPAYADLGDDLPTDRQVAQLRCRRTRGGRVQRVLGRPAAGQQRLGPRGRPAHRQRLLPSRAPAWCYAEAIAKLDQRVQAGHVITVLRRTCRARARAKRSGGAAHLERSWPASTCPAPANIRRYAEIGARALHPAQSLVTASDEIATKRLQPAGHGRSRRSWTKPREDLQDRRRRLPHEQGFQAMDALVVSCSTACRRWPTTRTTSRACPPASTTWTA